MGIVDHAATVEGPGRESPAGEIIALEFTPRGDSEGPSQLRKLRNSKAGGEPVESHSRKVVDQIA